MHQFDKNKSRNCDSADPPDEKLQISPNWYLLDFSYFVNPCEQNRHCDNNTQFRLAVKYMQQTAVFIYSQW